jgi:hypothetical protein
VDLRNGTVKPRPDIGKFYATTGGTSPLKSKSGCLGMFMCVLPRGDRVLFIVESYDSQHSCVRIVRGMKFEGEEATGNPPLYAGGTPEYIQDRYAHCPIWGQRVSPVSFLTCGQKLYIFGFGAYDWCPFATYQIDLNDLRGSFQDFENSDKGELAGAPRALFGTLYHNFLAVFNEVQGGDDSHPLRVEFSYPPQLNDGQFYWGMTGKPYNPNNSLDYVDLAASAGEEGTGIAYLNGQLVLLCSRSLWSLEGVPGQGIKVMKIADVGCVDPQTVKVIQPANDKGYVYFLGSDGVPKRTDGTFEMVENVGAYTPDGRSPIEKTTRKYISNAIITTPDGSDTWSTPADFARSQRTQMQHLAYRDDSQSLELETIPREAATYEGGDTLKGWYPVGVEPDTHFAQPFEVDALKWNRDVVPKQLQFHCRNLSGSPQSVEVRIWTELPFESGDVVYPGLVWADESNVLGMFTGSIRETGNDGADILLTDYASNGRGDIPRDTTCWLEIRTPGRIEIPTYEASYAAGEAIFGRLSGLWYTVEDAGTMLFVLDGEGRMANGHVTFHGVDLPTGMEWLDASWGYQMVGATVVSEAWAEAGGTRFDINASLKGFDLRSFRDATNVSIHFKFNQDDTYDSTVRFYRLALRYRVQGSSVDMECPFAVDWDSRYCLALRRNPVVAESYDISVPGVGERHGVLAARDLLIFDNGWSLWEGVGAVAGTVGRDSQARERFVFVDYDGDTPWVLTFILSSRNLNSFPGRAPVPRFVSGMLYLAQGARAATIKRIVTQYRNEPGILDAQVKLHIFSDSGDQWLPAHFLSGSATIPRPDLRRCRVNVGRFSILALGYDMAGDAVIHPMRHACVEVFAVALDIQPVGSRDGAYRGQAPKP